MFAKASTQFTKEIPVEFVLIGQEPATGAMFCKHGERLLDVLNDMRAFVPIRRADGRTVIVSKSSIATITEMARFDESGDQADARANFEDAADDAHDDAKPETADADGASSEEDAGAENDDAAAAAGEDKKEKTAKKSARPGADPFKILGVSREATIEEIRRAYKQRIKSVHPDTIAATCREPEVMRAAERAAQQVNSAYKAALRIKEIEEAGATAA